jgi:hypothetical protein
MTTLKINKSEIFRNAWKLKKENNWTLSASLKQAWKEAKGQISNDITALSSLVGHNFYAAYLNNGNTMSMYQFDNNWILVDNAGVNVEDNVKDWMLFNDEAKTKGYKNFKQMFIAEGHKIEFKA